jgi:hypothetical protein
MAVTTFEAVLAGVWMLALVFAFALAAAAARGDRMARGALRERRPVVTPERLDGFNAAFDALERLRKRTGR